MTNIPLIENPATFYEPLNVADTEVFEHLTEGVNPVPVVNMADYDTVFAAHDYSYSIEPAIVVMSRDGIDIAVPLFIAVGAANIEAFKATFNVPSDEDERIAMNVAATATTIAKYAAKGITLTFTEQNGDPALT